MKKGILFALTLCVLLSLAVPALGAEAPDTQYVLDLYDLLPYDVLEELEQRAGEISTDYRCGVYIVILEDYRDYGSGDVYDVTTQIYHNRENGFGEGPGRDGIVLLLSMDDRDWAMFVYGETAAYAFDAYAQEQLEDVFLDDFGDDDWYAGFSDYLDTCEEYLQLAQRGEPLRESSAPYILYAIGASLLIAFIVCMVMKGMMHSVRRKADANAYALGGIHLTQSYDQYTHTTVTRRKIETNNTSGGSRGHVGGGGSGRSGKF